MQVQDETCLSRERTLGMLWMQLLQARLPHLLNPVWDATSSGIPGMNLTTSDEQSE